MPHRPLCGFLMVWFFLAGTAAVAAPAGEPVVIGQTLPLAGPQHYRTARAIVASVDAYVQHVNASGGIDGRPLKVVTLDDGNDPAKHVANLHRLIDDEKAVAIINCLGDGLCRLTAETATARQIPVVGPISGASSLREGRGRYVFNVRPGYRHEADAMVRQMSTMGVASVALIAQPARNSEQLPFLQDALNHAGVKTSVIVIKPDGRKAIEQFLLAVKDGQFNAAIFDVGPEVLDALSGDDVGRRPEWPALVASLGGPAVPQLAAIFRGRTIGYTMVVPNPESATIPLVREYLANVGRYVTAEAISFVGLEAYINVRICVEALRRVRKPLSPKAVVTALESLGSYDLGGFFVNFQPGRSSASSWVDVGVVSKAGFFLN